MSYSGDERIHRCTTNETIKSDCGGKTVDVSDFIDSRKLSFSQFILLFLCFLVFIVDGYDASAIGYITPSLLVQWAIPKSALGPVMGAALIGFGVGAFFSGPLGDRIGRKTTIVLSVLWFGLFTILTALTTSIEHLVVIRLLTGLGLGAAAPNVMTIASEFAPARVRALAVNGMNCGFSAGIITGGLVSAWIIPECGWKLILYIGGIVPFALAAILIPFMPESVKFLAMSPANQKKIAKILKKLDRNANLEESTFTIKDGIQSNRNKKSSSVSLLLNKEYRIGSLMLWLTYFMGLLMYYLLMNWLPTLIKESGFSMKSAALITSLFPLGGVIGTICVGWCMDRFNRAATIAITYLLSAVVVFLTGHLIGYSQSLGVMLFMSGVLMIGANTSLSALAVCFYPTERRSTGVAWMLGIGRPGGVVGAWVGAILLGLGWNFGAVFSSLAVPSLIAAGAMLVMAPGKIPQLGSEQQSPESAH
jgi:MFS transporter, AAHS family, 4-hydroxybenzoate transporter